MDKAYEGDEPRELGAGRGLEPGVPPKANRVAPWEYDRELDKKRKEVAPLSRRIKRFRRVFTRFDKLEVASSCFLHCALIADTRKSL